MRYISTRGGVPEASFADVLLGGPAPDGGLYLPERWPQIAGGEIGSFAGQSYADVAYRVMRPFIGDAFADDDVRNDIVEAYKTFAHEAVAPLVQMAPNLFLLELFHGPTLAFKDIAMQLLGRLFARALRREGRRATVVVATSGDTGSAAIAALRGLSHVDVVVLHPKGRVSDVQRRQMTTVLDANVHNVAIEGNFDDAQSIVKDLFADSAFSARTNLTAVNSINFARVMAQCVYYFTAAAALGAGNGRAPIFVVPTGNFGDIFAGEAAWRMGLPVERLVIATNVNDILVRALHEGIYGPGRVESTYSPSMDIQVASNFERALFEAAQRDARCVAAAMEKFSKSRKLVIAKDILENLRARYDAGHATDDETLATISFVHKHSGMIVDPHTAVGVAAARKHVLAASGPVVVLATAHPAKFPEAVSRAIGTPAPIPRQFADLMAKEERYSVLPNSVDAVRVFIAEKTKPA